MEKQFALCRVCRRPTRQEPVVIARPDDDGEPYEVPVYHSECIPKERMAGHYARQPLIRRNHD